MNPQILTHHQHIITKDDQKKTKALFLFLFRLSALILRFRDLIKFHPRHRQRVKKRELIEQLLKKELVLVVLMNLV